MLPADKKKMEMYIIIIIDPNHIYVTIQVNPVGLNTYTFQ